MLNDLALVVAALAIILAIILVIGAAFNKRYLLASGYLLLAVTNALLFTLFVRLETTSLETRTLLAKSQALLIQCRNSQSADLYPNKRLFHADIKPN